MLVLSSFLKFQFLFQTVEEHFPWEGLFIPLINYISQKAQNLCMLQTWLNNVKAEQSVSIHSVRFGDYPMSMNEYNSFFKMYQTDTQAL